MDERISGGIAVLLMLEGDDVTDLPSRVISIVSSSRLSRRGEVVGGIVSMSGVRRERGKGRREWRQ